MRPPHLGWSWLNETLSDEAAVNILTGIETRPNEMVPEPMECGGMRGFLQVGGVASQANTVFYCPQPRSDRPSPGDPSTRADARSQETQAPFIARSEAGSLRVGAPAIARPAARGLGLPGNLSAEAGPGADVGAVRWLGAFDRSHRDPLAAAFWGSVRGAGACGAESAFRSAAGAG